MKEKARRINKVGIKIRDFETKTRFQFAKKLYNHQLMNELRIKNQLRDSLAFSLWDQFPLWDEVCETFDKK